MNLALQQIPTVHEKNVVLGSIVSGYLDTSQESPKQETHLDQWVLARITGALKWLDIVEEQDGRALVSIGKKHGREILTDQ